MYDNGLIKNFATYNRRDSPAYDLRNITAPVALFYGGGDALVAPEVRIHKLLSYKRYSFINILIFLRYLVLECPRVSCLITKCCDSRSRTR